MSDLFDDNFINVMINETCDGSLDKKNDSSEAVSNVVNLRDYFEKKVNEVEFLSLKEYLKDKNVKFVTLDYSEKTKMYRMTLNENIFDFPENWSVFKTLRTENYIELIHNDDLLNEIFAEFIGYDYQLTFLAENNQNQMIFVPLHQITKCKEWLREYVLRNQDRKKVA